MSPASLLFAALLFTAPATPAAQAQAAGKVAGRVTASDSGTPIAGARVNLFLTPRGQQTGAFFRPAEAITDQDGRFAFDSLAAGTYVLDVEKTGYVRFPETMAGPQTIEVGAGRGAATVDVQLQKGGIIAGRVLDAAGQPVADVAVMALRRTTLGSQERYLPRSGPGQTNDIGEFRVAGLAPGDYIVAATPRAQSPFGGPGLAPPAVSTARTTTVMTYYPGARDEATAQTIQVAAGQTVENVVFSILSAPAFRIAGVVVDEAGAPVAGAMIMMMPAGRGPAFMGPEGHAQSRDDGTFVVSPVPAGSYRLMASIPVTVTTSGTGGGSMTTWSSSGGGASGGLVAVTGGMVGGAAAGGTTMVMHGPQSMPQPTEVLVADADVAGVRVVVKR